MISSLIGSALTAPITVNIALVSLILYGIRTIYRCAFSPLDNIPGPPNKSWITGNLTQYFDPDGWQWHKDLKEKYGQVVKVHGWFGDRQLYIFDAMALNTMLVKDPHIFNETPKLIGLNYLIFGKGIFASTDDAHRKYRKIMLPAFSTASLRGMVPLFYEVAERVRDGLIFPSVRDGPQRLDFNSILSRASLELIGRTGIGYSFDPLIAGQEPTDRFAQALQEIIPTSFEFSLLHPLLPAILKYTSPAVQRFLIKIMPSPTLHRLRDLIDFKDAAARQLVRDREASIRSGDHKDDARDILSILMKGNLSGEEGRALTEEELVAATGTIILAATDTTSSSMNKMFHLMSENPEMQEKLREEILAAPEHLDLAELEALPYLDSFVRETLRLFPGVNPGVFRQTTQDTVLALSEPLIGVDGTPTKEISIPKGTSVYVGIAAANHNPRIWGPDVLEFTPERWTGGKAANVTTKLCGIYGNTMTFLGGERSCIGVKFSQIEMKVITAVLLRSFKFSSPDPRVKWRMTGIIPSPNIDNKPNLPILVERLKL
ncbi:cytochrome P450 [Mycena belliarum]|uniref:Cytochrome P450 n=1 Tax=Mycena belliarum TaxID=1033014 RepID=A0AAD6XLE8_9AGAR|nr:cytochrome P450 [Mycena belliae]